MESPTHRYVLGERIGRGGMGRVHRGWDRELGRPVAVKLLDDREPTASTRERFRREGLASARVAHRNVVRTLDALEMGDGTLALVMELVEGQALSHYLASTTPLPPGQAVDFALQIARGLAAIHGEGIVHRDLKPSNVLIQDGDPTRLAIADFGIARLPDVDPLTRDGTVLGTMQYMAPERFVGGQTTPAVDVYGFGAILYEMMLGRPPVSDTSPFEVCRELMERRDRPLRVGPDTGVLRPLLESCLAFDPRDRPRDGRALLALLTAAVEEGEATPRSDIDGDVLRALADL